MLAAKFHVDVVSETERLLQRKVEFTVPNVVIAELKRLAKGPGTAGRDARVALELVSSRRILCISTGEGRNADKALIEASRQPDIIVATADLSLRRIIRDGQKPVIFFREKAKLELNGIEAGYW
jgi:rRNA-processing protein FCF1